MGKHNEDTPTHDDHGRNQQPHGKRRGAAGQRDREQIREERRDPHRGGRTELDRIWDGR